MGEREAQYARPDYRLFLTIAQRLENEAEELRKNLKLADGRFDEMASQLQKLRKPILNMMAQMENISDIFISGQDLLRSSGSINNLPHLVAEIETTEFEGESGTNCDGAFGSGESLPGGLNDSVNPVPVTVRSLPLSKETEKEDADFVAQFGKRLSEDLNLLEKQPTHLTGDVNVLGESGSLQYLAETLSIHFGTPSFGDLARESIDKYAILLNQILQQRPSLGRSEAEDEQQIGLVCSGLRVVAYLLMSQAGDVELLLKQIDLVSALTRLLRFDVESWF